jgi:hypothetical protein
MKANHAPDKKYRRLLKVAVVRLGTGFQARPLFFSATQKAYPIAGGQCKGKHRALASSSTSANLHRLPLPVCSLKLVNQSNSGPVTL